jgi:nicotinamidase/pyrazinamidase
MTPHSGRVMTIEPCAGDALLIIDVQNDFLPGGALAVPEGNAVIDPLNRAIARFAQSGLPIIFTRDWHPADHRSFQSRGGAWPVHCVIDSPGAQFSASLHRPGGAKIVSKGTLAGDESYSNFEGTDLKPLLRRLGVQRIFVGGLATDYCVRYTVLDALRHGFRVFVLTDAIRAINRSPGDGQRAIDEMTRRGATLATTKELQ